MLSQPALELLSVCSWTVCSLDRSAYVSKSSFAPNVCGKRKLPALNDCQTSNNQNVSRALLCSPFLPSGLRCLPWKITYPLFFLWLCLPGVCAGEVRTRTGSAFTPICPSRKKCLGAGHPQVISTTTGAKQSKSWPGVSPAASLRRANIWGHYVSFSRLPSQRTDRQWRALLESRSREVERSRGKKQPFPSEPSLLFLLRCGQRASHFGVLWPDKDRTSLCPACWFKSLCKYWTEISIYLQFNVAQERNSWLSIEKKLLKTWVLWSPELLPMYYPSKRIPELWDQECLLPLRGTLTKFRNRSVLNVSLSLVN